jgi:mono/diheme cytochrome c family protein
MKRGEMKAGFQRSVRSPVLYPVRKLGHAVGWITATALASMSLAGSVAAEALDAKTRVLFERHCLNCHSTAKHKGDLDLEQVLQPGAESTDPKVWQQVLEQVSVGEMPPKDQPVMDAKAREQLMAGVRGLLDRWARKNAGDPGPVVLRRLANAEYTYTIRDLTGVESLDPAREFPVDSASGEGFMNVGQSLVMSPSLVTKYLDAAKEVARHAVLLPDGVRFSSSTSPRDWTEERLAAIRQFYGRYTQNGGGTAVNLQGIQFDTRDGGVLPLARYLNATLELRAAGRSRNATHLEALARLRGLNVRYLSLLWAELNQSEPSPLLDAVRARWREAKPGEGAAVAAVVESWQRSVWRFTTVGHIGKRDGPSAWQVPISPLATARETRFKLPAPDASGEVRAFLVSSDAGDGSAADVALWSNPRLVVPGRPDVPLSQLRSVIHRLDQTRGPLFSQAAACLNAAAELTEVPSGEALTALARSNNLEPQVFAAWLEALGMRSGGTRIEGLITSTLESAQGYSFIQGWTAADALSVTANSSDREVRVPGLMRPHSVAVHPSPSRRVIVGWRGPVAGTFKIEGLVQHSHTECGNGVSWVLELRRGATRQTLASGVSQGSKEVRFGPLPSVTVGVGDVVCLSVGPRDGNHSCDLTRVDLQLTDTSIAAQVWSLSGDVSPAILAGNPHADRLGHPAVWHFFSEPEARGGALETTIPEGSILARWRAAASIEEKRRWAADLQALFSSEPAGLGKDAPDAVLRRQWTSLQGPLLGAVLRGLVQQPELAISASASAPQEGPGPEPALFGKNPLSASSRVAPQDLCVKAPSVVEVRLPAEWAVGGELVATATLDASAGPEASVQMQLLPQRPASLALVPGAVSTKGGKGTWSDGELPTQSDLPVLVADGGAARRRWDQGLERFRALFPAALCYTKIVPVDEVVTLTLYHREDDALRRLMLTPAETAELERLWSELHYISQDAFKLVDAFEQLWQFATQDADPSAFTPMGEPIRRRADEFRRLLVDTEPAHLQSIFAFAARAYRRPLQAGEVDALKGLYGRLRGDGLTHEESVRGILARVLVSPAFLYRAEQPGPGVASTRVSDMELATRLSYFLWASTPDAELMAEAVAGRLHRPEVLRAQARRMLKNPKVERLATEFALAWLHLYDFETLDEKSERHFPEFRGLRGAMREETVRFFTDLFQNNGPVLDILDADHSFLNADLAGFYGVTSVSFTRSNEWKRVTGLRPIARGGILGQASTLARQSGASRTSPILRGNWISEVILGEKLPKPPKDVPRLPEDESLEQLTVRQLTEKHSSDPKCSGCHRRIDAYGFSLESFDAVGRFRERDLGGRALDVRAKVLDGTVLEGAAGLRRYLSHQRKEAFLRQFSRKLLGYSLGRGVLLSDEPLLSDLQRKLSSRDARVQGAVETIVASPQFVRIRGMDRKPEE